MKTVTCLEVSFSLSLLFLHRGNVLSVLTRERDIGTPCGTSRIEGCEEKGNVREEVKLVAISFPPPAKRCQH